MKFNPQRGVALVITLIMLSVITFLAVAFLALTRRDKASVNVSVSQTDARFMADTALARAEAEIISRMIAKDTLLAYDLMVSRNYINPNGFVPGDPSPLNVNYDYKNSGGALNDSERIQNIGNLFYDARPPVYIMTNENGPADFRFYVDFNRDGRFDTNGLQDVLDDSGNTNGQQAVFIGDPEWIGLQEKPQYPHSGTNRFPGRYAYIVVPEGKTLDINFMHNYGKGNANPGQFQNAMPLNPGDGLLRNQGVGSWELNLGAFFEGLNPNHWSFSPYIYETNAAFANRGYAFEDAHSILRYRYATNHSSPNLQSAKLTLGNPVQTEFTSDFIDSYSDGPLLYTNSSLRVENDDVDRPWPGSRNPKAYRDIQELFDRNKTSQQFTNRLRAAIASTNSHDRQTFTRLLSQLGTSSDTNNIYVVNGKSYPKIHLNYDNVTPNTDGFVSQTNFFQWEPIVFFTNTAEALIRKSLIPLRDPSNNNQITNYYLGGLVGTNFNLTNIMVYPTNQYSPAVHRLLQLSANIYAATTNGSFGSSGTSTNCPFVFRPVFKKINNSLVITGYEEVTSFTNVNEMLDASLAATTNNLPPDGYNIWGIPWVVSAKKGFPNFNEFSVDTVLQLTRKMELVKPSLTAAPNQTNLMYVVGITNYIGTELWNSYTQNFVGRINYRFTNFYDASLTNDLGVVLTNQSRNFVFNNPTPILSIPAAVNKGTNNANSFLVNKGALNFIAESQYSPSAPYFKTAKTNAVFESSNGNFYVTDWKLTVTNKVMLVVEDLNSGRVLDFVNLDNLITHIDLPKELTIGDDLNVQRPTRYSLWRTNRVQGGTTPAYLTEGMNFQLQLSKGAYGDALTSELWLENSPTTFSGRKRQIDEFLVFLGQSPINGSTNLNPTNRIQVPYSPTVALYLKNYWQANDPLVHYTAIDLQDFEKPPVTQWLIPPTQDYATFNTNSNLGKINDRYSPWGGTRLPGKNPDTTHDDASLYELGIKDPMVRWSDDWDFPTNKFPNIGTLGRVHRGTPWQSVYLKARVVAPEVWQKWGGSDHTHPTNDWFLLDLFTAAPNDNAARGLLSVNQTNFAAWSAVLSGVQVLTNSSPPARLDGIRPPLLEAMSIEPTSWQLNNIISGINRARTNRPNQVFSSVAEVLATPELTIGTGTNGSPYFYLGDDINSPRLKNSLTDAAVERIPQQVLSLLKVGYPRFTVYSFGQALRPAQNSIVNSAPLGRRELLNLCTNYQISGEVVTRTVLRVEGTPQNPKAVVETFEILHED